MRMDRGFLLLSLFGVFGVAVAGGQELVQEAIQNWSAPATWSPPRAHGLTTLSSTSPLPFIAVTPCRVADTRGNGFGGAYGPPALVANTTRDFTLTGQCGIPANAVAVSSNLAALNVYGPGGDLRVFPAGDSAPLVSTLNYDGNTHNISNAAVVALGTGGAITVLPDAVGIDLIVDVNGYYAAAGSGSFNTFLGRNAGNSTMTGDNNSGFGYGALFSNTTGVANTAIGHNALFSNTSSGGNTAIGDSALFGNGGGNNTAIGAGALGNNEGNNNTATGESALRNTKGHGNTATGQQALVSNTTGQSNTAIGAHALPNVTTAIHNIGIGASAGMNLTTGNYNICIDSPGVEGESGTIRIGDIVHGRFFLAGVQGVMTGGTGTPVLIDANGQLGTISSSARVKDGIQDMGDATEGLLKLRPVTFRYKAQPEGRTQFGLIAEEVEKVMPELVVCSSSGEVETVLYHEMPAMLLNELQKQQREIQELKSELSALRAIIGQK
jgi:Chaperone of endosialidase